MPLSEISSWMSRSRHGAPLIAYSESPLRNSVRVIVTSLNSIGSRFAELSIVSDTSARPSAGRSAVPAKMTSSILTPRSVNDFRNTPQLLLDRSPSVRAVSGGRADRAGCPIGASDLAVRAEERRPAGVLLAHDGAAAAQAGLAVAGVHLVVLLVPALLAEQVHVLLVGERRPAVLDAVLEHLDHGAVQAPHLLGAQLVAHAVVAQPGVMEDLVGVDVADAGDELLVHEPGLQLHVALGHQLAEVVPAHGALERVEAEMSQLVDLVLDAVELGDEHLAERARVDEPQLPALGEGDDHVGVLGQRLLGAGGPPQLARHPEVDHQHLAAVELDEQVLAPSLDAHELLAHHRLGELLALPVPA